ncbi:MAG TPA: ferritin [Candidatus Cloacimonetes bacterium]|nr:ferritin [Candidatus Cloacimonadota bacterium]
MISKKMIEAINEQINKELYSAYIYLSMSAWFEEQSLSGMANWMHEQAKEEYDHAMRFFKFLTERGAQVILKAIEQPETEFKTPLNAFEMALEHEKFITGSINDLMSLAIKENDYATKSFLYWFIDEQVEEEDSVSAIVDDLKLVGDKGHGILMINRELGERTFSPDED